MAKILSPNLLAIKAEPAKDPNPPAANDAIGSPEPVSPDNIAFAYPCVKALEISPPTPMLPTAPYICPIPAVTNPEIAPIPIDLLKSPQFQLLKPPSLVAVLTVYVAAPIAAP